MNQYILADLNDRIDQLLEILIEHEELCFVAIEVAHHLKDEISQIDIGLGGS